MWPRQQLIYVKQNVFQLAFPLNLPLVKIPRISVSLMVRAAKWISYPCENWIVLFLGVGPAYEGSNSIYTNLGIL